MRAACLLDFLTLQPQRRARMGGASASPLLFRASCALPNSGNQTMAKPATIKIRLNSTADTGFFYVTKKNPRNTTEKMTFRKYDPVARKHVEFKEGKIK